MKWHPIKDWYEEKLDPEGYIFSHFEMIYTI